MATLLPDGDVLVVGGSGARGSGEIWDHGTETFRPAELISGTDALTRAAVRAAELEDGVTATILPDRSVLVIGGLGGGSWQAVLDSATVWDPATGSSRPAGTLSERRAFHTATLLPDGRVLVTGGANGQDVSSAEIWDAATETFEATGPLRFARSYHTATLLPGGDVLVVGGIRLDEEQGGYIADGTAEVWDHATGTFRDVAWPPEFRASHTATLLPDGRVLVAGGRWADNEVFASTQLWDPAAG